MIFVPIILFISSSAVLITFLYLYFSTRHKERMALIESGRDAKIFKEERPRYGTNSLKFGLFFVFVGVGLFTGIMIETQGLDVPEASVTIPLVLISAGAALLVYYRLVREHVEEDNDKPIV